MASSTSLPPDLFDATTVFSLTAVGLLLFLAYELSVRSLERDTPTPLHLLFIWHAFDATIHFFLEGGFLYHCFFSAVDVTGTGKGTGLNFYPDPVGYLGGSGRAVHGSQAGVLEETGWMRGLAGLWMVYARADRRWGGVDLSIVSLELLTVLVVGPLAVFACYDISKKNPRANITMIVLATAELYGGFITFCPEWLVGNINLDTSNYMYQWVYLVFFNMLWVFFPLYSIWYSATDIMDAFKVRSVFFKSKKTN